MASQNNDLINAVCGGYGKRFGNIPCRYYDKFSNECLLLRETRMDEFWDKCRCNNLELVDKAISKNLKVLREKYRTLSIDDREDVEMDKIISRLKKRALEKGFTLAVWYGYVRNTIYREIKNFFISKGLIPSKIQCGTCRHLSKSNGYVCLKKNVIKKKEDAACENFDSAKPKQKIECNECSHLSRNPSFFCYHRGEKRNKTDNICEGYGQNIIITEYIDSVPKDDEDNKKRNKKIIDEISVSNSGIYTAEQEKPAYSDMEKMLNKRIETAVPGTKKRRVYERQYYVLVEFYSLISDGIGEKEAKDILSKELKVDIKTIRLDFKDIRDFLKEKMSSE